MDVIKLDKAGSTYLPTDLVEGYDSMIWTERFLDPGDFQMNTSKIAEMRALIPEGSLISLRDSAETMIVESHKITVDDNDVRQLLITGRSATTILDSRVFGGELTSVYTPDNQRYQLAREAAERALLLIYDSIVQVPTNPISGVDRPVYDQIPNVAVSLSRIASTSTDSSILTFGTALEMVTGLLTPVKQGLRTIRPPTPINGSSFFATFTSAWGPAAHATYTSRTGTTDPRMLFDVYDGKDRSAANSGNVPVIFDYQSGTLDDPTYLWSIKDYKNFLVMWTSVQEQNIVTAPGVASTTSGWDRRSGFLDASSWDQVGTDSSGVFTDIGARGAIELAKLLTKAWFDGEVSKISPYKFKTDFNLGDIVQMRADYGFNQPMRVTEYIRTEDASGDRGYPTLVTV